METPLAQVLIVGALIAAASGVLGSFALLKRMALVGDALSHVAFPGIALGLMFNFNPFLGALAFLILGITIIWLIEHKTRLPVDTLVGIMFSLALAIGAILVPEEKIEEVLFGNIMAVSSLDLWLAAVLSLGSLFFLITFYKRLTLTMISRDLSYSAGSRPHLFEFLFLLVFALMVATGIKFAGALLIGSLIIIPAAIARNIASSMKNYLLLSGLIGTIGALFSVYVSFTYGLEAGPVFVIASGIVFFISVFLAKR